MHSKAIETTLVTAVPDEGSPGALQAAQLRWLLAHSFSDDRENVLPLDPTPRTADQPQSERSGTPAPRVLIIDDERLIANTVVRILNLNGFQAVAAYSGDDALALVDTFCPDIVLTDVRMPGRNGIEVGNLIRERCPETRVVLFSGQAGVSNLIEAARSGHGFELWSKPLAPPELVRRLRALSSEY